MSAAILNRLGLTPDSIRKHVVHVQPPLPKWDKKYRVLNVQSGLTARGTVRKQRKSQG